MSRVRRRKARGPAVEPFGFVYLMTHRDDPAALRAYWQLHRDEWIEWHQARRGPDSMPDEWWQWEAQTLVADDPAEPIDWRDWADERSLYHLGYGHVSEEYLEHAARAKRLAQRRRDYLSVGTTR